MLIAVGDHSHDDLKQGILAMADESNGFYHDRKDLYQGKPYKHGNGWSFAHLDEEKGEWVVLRSMSEIYEDLELLNDTETESPVKIFHARKATIGSEMIQNTHNFFHHLPGYGSYLLSHNGDIHDDFEFDEHFKMQGNTDSEGFFYSILSLMKNEKLSEKDAIIKAAKGLKNYEGANIIFAGKNRSYVLVFHTDYPTYYGMQIAELDNCLIVSSEKLKHIKSNWKGLQHGDLVEIDNVTREYTIHRVL